MLENIASPLPNNISKGLYDADKIKEVISNANCDNVRNKHYVNFNKL